MKWRCWVCGWIYDEANGLPEQRVSPGTRFEDLPSNWTCPICGAPRDEFERVE